MAATYLRDGSTVNLERVSSSIGLSIQDLLDGDRTKRVLCVVSSTAGALLAAAFAGDEPAAASAAASTVGRI
jgi:hypothetical protein